MTKNVAPNRANTKNTPVKSGAFPIKNVTNTAKKNMTYLAGHASRFKLGCTFVTMAWTAKKSAATAMGRKTPAVPAHC